jgi:hypothetical protein
MIELTVLQDCATIQLTRGLNTLVDAADRARLSQKRWHSHRYCRGAYYARQNGTKGSKSKPRMHQVVLTASAGPPPPGMECRHLNGDSLDNRSANLSWGTRAENAADAVSHGTHSTYKGGRSLERGKRGPARGESNGSAKLRTADVLEIRRVVAAGGSRKGLARRFGVNPTTITKIVARKKWSHV